MKLHRFKSFNEGLFTNENDDQIGSTILEKLSEIDFEVEKTDQNQYMVSNIKLDENPGTYNVLSDFFEIKLEYYKNNKLQFKQILKCNATIRKGIFITLQNKYLAKKI